MLRLRLEPGQELIMRQPTAWLQVEVPSPAYQIGTNYTGGIYLVPEEGMPARLLTTDLQLPGCGSLVHIIDEVGTHREHIDIWHAID